MDDEISQTHSAPPMRTVAVTGGTGYVGSALIDSLVERHFEVVCLTRNTETAGQMLPPGVVARKWLSHDEPSKSLLDGVDAVVHLAGAPAVGVRYTRAKKAQILASRVETTRTLVATMRHMTTRPRVLLCASAVGYYGAHGADERIDENAAPGSDFLASVCAQWEAAAREAEDLGVRVVRARIGIVFGEGGGPLEVMARPFRFFVGGPLAGGKQMVSWVDRRDVIRALCFCLEKEDLHGAVNLCAPEPASNATISTAIARVLHRPSVFPVPEFGLRLLFGDGAQPIVTGQRVVPAALQNAGFVFEHDDLDACLRDHLAT